MKPLEGWGTVLSLIKHAWKKQVMWKLILTNSLVIGIVIWLAGVSVKEFACLLVEQSPLFDQEKSQEFNRVMQSYLVDASLFAVSVAAVFHYYVIRNMLKPLQQLAAASRKMTKGHYPDPVQVKSRDEIGQLANDFNKMMVQLKQVDGERNKLMRDISHELRTPLTNINGYLEALSSGLLSGDREIYQSLYEESTRLTRLVDQLQQLNVWESKETFHNRVENVSIASLIEASIDVFKLEFQAAGIECETSLQTETVFADPDGLKQVMYNLLKNAILYDIGGWIKVEGIVAGDHYRVTVTNKGKPIPKAEAENIFKRFTRLDSSRSRDTGGAGLGLSIVKEIVMRHGGEVGLTSEEGRKHSFWFSIPL